MSVVSFTVGSMYLDFVTWATEHIFLFPRALQKAVSALLQRTSYQTFPCFCVPPTHAGSSNSYSCIFIIISLILKAFLGGRRCKAVNSVLSNFKAGTRNNRVRSAVFWKFRWEVHAGVLSVMKSPREAVRNENNMLWWKEASIKNAVWLKMSSSNNSLWWCFLTILKQRFWIQRATVALSIYHLYSDDTIKHTEVVLGVT